MRWVILSLIVLAQTVANIGPLGIPAIASLIRDDLGLTLAQAGSFLSAYYIGPVTMSLFGGMLADRWGTARTLVLGQAIIAVGLLAASVAPTYGVFVALLIVAGVGYGALNPTSTTAAMSWFPPRQRATVVGLKQVGLPFGGMLGAALASYMLGADVPPRLQLFGVCGGIAIIVFIASRGMLDTHAPSGEEGGEAHFAWPKGLLLIIGLLIFAGMTAEGVMYDWSVLYLKQDVGMPQAEAALGYATFSAAVALSRFGGDFLRSRYSERALLRFGASMAAVAMAVVLLAANAWVAFLGFALVGAGLAPVAPILFNAATRVPGVSRAAAASGKRVSVAARAASCTLPR